MKVYKLLDQFTPQLIAEKINLADNFSSRLVGLLGKLSIEEDEGLLLYPCASIHTYFMKFPVDVAFLNHEKEIIAIKENLMPKNTFAVKGAVYVLELKAGFLKKKNISLRDKLYFE